MLDGKSELDAMKRPAKVFLSLVTWLGFSLTIAHTWMANPEIFPSLPLSAWRWLDSYYRTRNAEEVADLEFLVIFTISALIGLLCFLLVYTAQRKMQIKSG